jgi:hypothetical protein
MASLDILKEGLALRLHGKNQWFFPTLGFLKRPKQYESRLHP